MGLVKCLAAEGFPPDGLDDKGVFYKKSDLALKMVGRINSGEYKKKGDKAMTKQIDNAKNIIETHSEMLAKAMAVNEQNVSELTSSVKKASQE